MSQITSSARIDATRHLNCGLLAILSIAALAPMVQAAETIPAPASVKPEAVKAAGILILVRNEAGATLKGREQALEDLISSRIAATTGLAVISRTDAIKRLGAAEKTELDGAKVDAAFEDRTSALALAQSLGAKGILTATLVALGSETVEFSGAGITTTNTTHTLRATWKISDAEQAAGLRGDSVTATRTIRATQGLKEVPGDLVNGLLDDIAVKIANGIRPGAAGDRDALTRASSSAKRAKFSIGITADNLFFPELSVNKDGILQVDRDRAPVRLSSVIVELDGAVIGSAPFATPVEVRPGLHRIRLSRDGFTPWEGVVSVFDGFNFSTALELNPTGLARWREQIKFIEGLKAGVKLTESEIGMIKAKAESLRNYGFKIDVKVDADKLPDDKSNIINVVPGAALPTTGR